jgi:hypothetical protein
MICLGSEIRVHVGILGLLLSSWVNGRFGPIDVLLCCYIYGLVLMLKFVYVRFLGC